MTKLLLSLPRNLLLLVLFLLGPAALVIALIRIVGGATVPLAALLPCALFTAMFVWLQRSRLLKPSEKTLDGVKTMGATLVDLSSKAATATEEWAKQKQVEAREAKIAEEKRRREARVYDARVRSRSLITPMDVVVLGGGGWEGSGESKRALSFDTQNIYLSDMVQLDEAVRAIGELRDIEVGGPGRITTNASVIGGGFGLQGAATGMAVAALANLLTTHSNTKTVIRLGFQTSEIFIVTSQMEPEAARILLSPLFLAVDRSRLSQSDRASVVDEVRRLFELKQTGAITDDEYEQMKKRLLG